jgi:protein SON
MFRVAAPVQGGMGMQLLKKMGWEPGKGLGRDLSGSVDPLVIDVKPDKKGKNFFYLK